MSAFLVEVTLSKRQLRYINASHVSAVILPKEDDELTWKNVVTITDPISPHLGSEDKVFHIGAAVPTAGTRPGNPPQRRLAEVTMGLAGPGQAWRPPDHFVREEFG